MTSQAADHRRAAAERNVAAILDAAAELLSQQGAASIAAVAAQAGVSRVTVAVLASADLAAGPPMEALRRLIAAGWLVTSFFALIHACAGDVHAGRLDAGDAPRVLTLTVMDLFAGERR
jgi:Bacterial regulatory proteins, tetR family